MELSLDRAAIVGPVQAGRAVVQPALCVRRCEINRCGARGTRFRGSTLTQKTHAPLTTMVRWSVIKAEHAASISCVD